MCNDRCLWYRRRSLNTASRFLISILGGDTSSSGSPRYKPAAKSLIFLKGCAPHSSSIPLQFEASDKDLDWAVLLPQILLVITEALMNAFYCTVSLMRAWSAIYLQALHHVFGNCMLHGCEGNRRALELWNWCACWGCNGLRCRWRGCRLWRGWRSIGRYCSRTRCCMGCCWSWIAWLIHKHSKISGGDLMKGDVILGGMLLPVTQLGHLPWLCSLKPRMVAQGTCSRWQRSW